MNEQSFLTGTNGTHNICEKISFVVISIITFLIPFFFLPVHFISTQFDSSLLFAFGTIIALFLLILSICNSHSFLVSRSIYMFGLFMLVPIVYILAGFAHGFSRLVFLGYTFDITTVGFIILAFAYMFLVSSLFVDRKKIFYAYVGCVVSSLVVSIFLISRIFFGPQFLSFGIFQGLTDTMIGNWSNVGIFFGIILILSFIRYSMLSVSTFMKWLLFVTAIFSLIFIVLVSFNIVWAMLAVSSFLFIVYTYISKKRTQQISSWKGTISFIPLLPVVIFVISCVGVVYGSTLSTPLISYLKLQNIDVRPSLSVTVTIAKETLRNEPLFGSGPNSFVTEWLSYRPNSVLNTVFWNTDFRYGIGLLPTFAITTGLVGFLSWLIFFGIYLYCGVTSIFAIHEDLFTRYLVVSSFFISLYLWIIAWSYIPSVVIFVLTFFFTGLFFASIYMAHVVPRVSYKLWHAPNHFMESVLLVVCFILLCALTYGLFTNSESLWYFQKSSYALNTQNDLPSAELFMKKAIQIVPYDVYYRSLSEIELVKLKNIESNTSLSKDQMTEQFNVVVSDAVSAGISAEKSDQTNYLNWISLGNAYASAVPSVSSAYQNAEMAYNQAFITNPKNPGIFLLLAQLDISNGNVAQAQTDVLQAISIKSNYSDAYVLLAQIQFTNNDIQGAIDSLTKASVIDPTDESTLFQLGVLKYYNKDFSEAIVTLEKSLSISPTANAEYFLGLSFEANGEHANAITVFQDLAKTNPNNTNITSILSNLLAGKPIFVSPPITSTTLNKKASPVLK